MVDELELLKKDWQKKAEHLPKLSYDEIYQMIWKKSSSIVKWIFYISIIEFVVPHLLYLIPSMRNNMNLDADLGITKIVIGVTVVQYTVILYFIYLFYKRYKEISVLDNAKQLTQNILNTRKTVKHYVIFSLSMILFTFLMIAVGVYFNDGLLDSLELGERLSNVPREKVRWILMAIFAVFGVVVTFVFGGIYFLLYGLLTRKLRKNYRELQKLEV
ncbi:hypothetical protein [Flagellimonas onchidii]|uniref:hypothetical protein n=1 Tax=Flagellimonas onchidii TaxID=2562684 RepID=UPI0010A695D2|nr:hypothetical protein [Allomuricauda onchidii]